MNCSFERAEMRSKDEEEHRMTERERVIQIVDALAPELKTLALNIHDNPELGLQEFKACAWQKELLAKYGFEIEASFCDIATSYKAVYKGKK